MGNRANLILNNKSSKKELVFEANNHLPFFWLLLLDLRTIQENESKFLSCFENQNENCDPNFKINRKVFDTNSKVAGKFLERFHPELFSMFEEFSKYISEILSENSLELDFIEIASFYSSPTEFLNKIKDTISSFGKMSPLSDSDLSEYLTYTDYFYLVGFDNYVNIEYKFSNFSKDYLSAKKIKEKQRQELIKERQKLKTKEKNKSKLANNLPILIGICILSLSVIRMVYNNSLKNGFFGILLGLFIIVYSLNRKRKNNS